MIRRPPRSTLFPYTRSSDLLLPAWLPTPAAPRPRGAPEPQGAQLLPPPPPAPQQNARDRKSTRLNSSHGYISYAVFCLKKKKQSNHYCVASRLLRTRTLRPP